MEKGQTCTNCSKTLPAVNNLFFCPFCTFQLKCKVCSETLLPEAKACFNCGSFIKEHTSGTTIMNEFDYEEKGDSKKLRSRFTNEVGSTFAEAFGMMFGGNVQSRRVANPFTIAAPKGSLTPAAKSTQIKDIAEDAIIVTGNTFDDLLLRYFKFEENKLQLVNSRLKQTGKLDHSIRLAILTLYAYERLDQQQIEKATLSEIMGSAKLYDTHFQGWLNKCDEIVKNANKIQLSVPGREAAQEILQELADESVMKGLISFSKTAKGSGKRQKKKQNDSAATDSGAHTSSSTTSRTKGPIYYLELLIKDGYFSQKRKLGDILEYLKVNKAETYLPNRLSTPLKRLIKSGKLKREKNLEGQYEYYV